MIARMRTLIAVTAIALFADLFFGAVSFAQQAQSTLAGGATTSPAPAGLPVGGPAMAPASTGPDQQSAALGKPERSYGPDLAGVLFKPLEPLIGAINHGIEPVDTALVPVSAAVRPLVDPIAPPDVDPASQPPGQEPAPGPQTGTGAR